MTPDHYFDRLKALRLFRRNKDTVEIAREMNWYRQAAPSRSAILVPDEARVVRALAAARDTERSM